MLRQRIITALVLLAVLVPTLFVPSPWPFALLTMVAIAASGWEWGRLNEAGDAVAIGFGVALALACLVAWSLGWTERLPAVAWWVASAGWVFAGTWLLAMPVRRWKALPRQLRWAAGLLALWIAWLALANAKSIGVNFLLSMLCLAWAADIGAYFGGRRFGRRKLAPAISPAKSWEGVWSGMLGGLLLSLAWLSLDRHFELGAASLYTGLLERIGALGLAFAVLVLCGMSVLGDLLESLVKRGAGAKDSSRLLPGHGGVLDRVDALLPVMPLAMALMSISA